MAVQRRSFVRLIAATVLLVAGAACVTWGPVEYSVGPFAYGTDATGALTAIAVTYETTQERHPPSILGTAPRINVFGTVTWLCDANARQFRSLALVPSGLPVPGDSVIIANWQTDHFSIHVFPFSSWFEVWTSGADSAVTPADTVRASQVITPYCATGLDSLRAVPAAALTWTGK